MADVAVRFTKHHNIYNSGEVAGFAAEAAEKLVAEGVAEYQSPVVSLQSSEDGGQASLAGTQIPQSPDLQDVLAQAAENAGGDGEDDEDAAEGGRGTSQPEGTGRRRRK